MKRIFFIAALFAAAITAPVTTSAQMYNSSTGAKVSHAFPLGCYGTNNYIVFPSVQDTTVKSADTITFDQWAGSEFLNIDTLKLHKNIVKLATPYAAVLGTPTPLTGYQFYLTAHEYDSTRSVYIMQPNGIVSDTVTVSRSVVRHNWIFKAITGKWEFQY